MTLPIDTYVPSTAAVEPVLLRRDSAEFHEFMLRPDSAPLARFPAYWDTKREGEPAPLRVSIDPTEVASLLTGIFMVDVVDGPPLDFRYRLAGSDIVQSLEYNFTGKLLSEVFPLEGMFAAIWKQYRAAISDEVTVRLGVGGMADHNFRYRVPISVTVSPLRTEPASGRIGQLLGYVKYYRDKMQRVSS